jgi:hypothetical protein
MSRIKQVPSWVKHPKPKSAELVIAFERAFRRVWLCFGLMFGGMALLLLVDKLIVKVPLLIGVPFALVLSLALLMALYLACFGKARCPNCGQLPLQRSGLAAGIPLRIARCRRCDYPLRMEELEKDRQKEAAEAQRTKTSSSSGR